MLKSIAFAALALSIPATAGFINFDAGTDVTPVGSDFAGLGVTFSNTNYRNLVGAPSAPNVIAPISDNDGDGFEYTYSILDKMVATFSTPQNFVSLDAFDTGGAGIRFDAYDDVVGGNFVGFAQFIGSGFGTEQIDTISLNAPNIRRIEIYQPDYVTFHEIDGIGIDNLFFTAESVPEPGSFSMLLLAAVPVIYRLRRRARK